MNYRSTSSNIKQFIEDPSGFSTWPSELLGRVLGGLHWHEVGVEPPRRVRHELDDGRKQVRRDSEPRSRDSNTDFSKRARMIVLLAGRGAIESLEGVSVRGDV